MYSPAVGCVFALIEITVVMSASTVSLSKGFSLSLLYISTKLSLILTGKVGYQLCIRKTGENFVEACLLTLCANKTHLIMLGQSLS